MSAANYYILSVGFAAVFFFVGWGVLRDYGDDAPWISSGIGAAIVMIGAVVFREIVLRREYRRKMMASEFQTNFRPKRTANVRDRDNKLTIEKNAAILSLIKQKSEAARILDRLSAGHFEVFELCREYIQKNEDELKTVAASSPRLAPLLRGRSAAAELQRFHLLRWAEIEARELTNVAGEADDPEHKLKAAKKALGVIEVAGDHYPDDRSLAESGHVIREMIMSIKVTRLVEAARNAELDGDNRGARRLYRDALVELGSDNVSSTERRRAADRISAAIEKLEL
jgi:hypothetical protein